MIERRSKNV